MSNGITLDTIPSNAGLFCQKMIKRGIEHSKTQH